MTDLYFFILTAINLFVLLLRHLFQSIHLAVLGFDSGTVDDDERITCLDPFAFLHEKGIYAAGEFPADAYLCGLYLSLQHHWLPAHK